MTTGLTGITLSTILQQPLPSRFLLTVLAVEGDTAVIAVNGKAMEVHSEIPLQPGQTLLVSQEQGAGGETRLHPIGDGAAPETSGRQIGPEGERQIDLLTALRLADLPVTAEAINKMAALLKTLGGDLSLPNLLAAAAFSESGLTSDQILSAVVSFLNSLLAQPQNHSQDEEDSENGAEPALKQAVLARVQELVETLQRLASQPEGGQKLDTVLQALVAKNGESGRQAVGGQVYTSTQTDQEGQKYFYLPLHAILNNYGLRNCELYIYPPSQQNGEDGQETWLFTLTLETETLGWMQFGLVCQNRQVAVQALVERPSTKQALDNNWLLLDAGLSSLNLKLTSQRCGLGQVHSQTRSIQDLRMQFQQYNPFDISI